MTSSTEKNVNLHEEQLEEFLNVIHSPLLTKTG